MPFFVLVNNVITVINFHLCNWKADFVYVSHSAIMNGNFNKDIWRLMFAYYFKINFKRILNLNRPLKIIFERIKLQGF